MSAWQPIETAPRDGTHVLLWSVYPQLMEWEPDVVSAWWGYDDPPCWVLVDAGDGFHDNRVSGAPTHWMPLPGPPA